jgi:hypothetical protein
MQGYVVAGGLRPVPANGGTAEEAHSYAQQMKVYPLADAATPKPTRYVDGFPKSYRSLPAYDASWFRELAAMVNEEPVRERDKVMMGMLASIGIERGKPFQPDAKLQKALDSAIVDARRIMQQYFVTPGQALTPWWQGSQWTAFSPKTLRLANGFTYETDDALWIDARGAACSTGRRSCRRSLVTGSRLRGKNFFLIFRLYGPEKAFFEKTWRLPGVEKVQ